MSEVELYGNDHSPWVQAVMLGLHQKHQSYVRTTVPPGETFMKSGVMMPAARFDGGPWQLESKDILQRLGFAAVSDEDLHAVQATWRGVLHRADYWPRFWGEFSLASDPSSGFFQRQLNNFLRSFTILYFFVLIRFAASRVQDPENFGDQYVAWEERFAAMEDPFLGGAEPDALDLLLFGIVQCHCSIPVPPIWALQSDTRLARTREWIGRMQQYFSDYPSLYSGVYFAPHSPAPKPASPVEQLSFWFGAIVMIGFFWITIPLIIFLAYRIRNQRP